MNKVVIVAWSVCILLIQVLILNHINFSGYINPYLYVAFIFIFPLSKNRFPFLIMAFFYGLCIDFFSDTGGIHAFSLVFVSYLRPLCMRIYFKKADIDYLLFRLNKEPFGQVFNYVVTLTFIHHLVLLTLENFSFQNLGTVLLNVIYSCIFTLLLYFLGSYIFRKKQAN